MQICLVEQLTDELSEAEISFSFLSCVGLIHQDNK